MSETVKHTLETWQVRTDLDGKPKLDSRDGYTVERADPEAGKPFVVSTWSLDDARLIAAAPCLLHALKDALRSSRKDFKRGPLGDHQHQEAYAEQFAAIAKATGASNAR